MTYLLLIVGFVLLIKGADMFVDGSSSLAKTLKIPTVIIGLTIVAMGTSAPEASVSIHAAFAGNNDIALSNVIGSNIFNTLMVVGVCATMKVLTVDKDIIKRDLPMNMLASLILCMMMKDGRLERQEGIILLVIMVIYILMMFFSVLKNRTTNQEINVLPLPVSLIYIVLGLIAIIFGGNLVVDHASQIALTLGLSQNFVGLTIIAIGTSLPELVTSIVATRKGESHLALGNAIGSNIFNIFFILGTSATLSPLRVMGESIMDSLVLVFVSVIIFFFAQSNHQMERKDGLICIILYMGYMVYLFMR